MRYLGLLLLISLLNSCIIKNNHTNSWYTRHYQKNVRKRENKNNHKASTWYKDFKTKTN